MQPRVNVIPDPSAGLFTCAGGMATSVSPHNLSQSQCQLLRNFYPGQPAKPRTANRDIVADDTILSNSGSHVRYLPNAFAVKDTDGNLCFVVVGIERDGSNNKYVYEIWNPNANTRTRIFNGLTTANTYFGMCSVFDALYICSNNAFTDNYYQNGAAPSGGDPLGHKIIEYYGTSWIVRDMHLEAPNMTYPLECVDAAPANIEFDALANFQIVCLDNRLWLFGGYDNVLLKLCTDILMSEDGVNWVSVGNLPVALYSHAAVVYDNKVWIIGGKTGTGAAAISKKVYCSTDCITWTEVGTNSLPVATYDHRAVSYNGKMWISGGAGVGGIFNTVYYSTDGITWTPTSVNGALPKAFSGHGFLVYDNKMWTICGAIDGISGTAITNVYYSTDGATWTQTTDAFPGSGVCFFGYTVYNNKMWTAGGLYTNIRCTYYSTDGITWTEAGTNSLPAGGVCLSGMIVYNNKMFLVAGLATASKPIYSSTDGVTWTYEKASGNSAGVVLSHYVSVALTAVRRTDAASKFSALADYTYPAWNTYNGKTVVAPDEKKIAGTVTLSGTGVNNLVGVGTHFAADLKVGDYIRIDGLHRSYLVTALNFTDYVNSFIKATVTNTNSDSYTAKECAVLPKVGDPITVDTYNAGVLESIEDSDQRQVIYTTAPTTATSRIALRLPDVMQLRNAGATHLRVWMTLGADDETTAKGLSHGFVADISITGDQYDSNKVYFIDKTNDDTDSWMGGVIADGWVLTVTGYTAPPNGCFIEHAGDRMWIAGETGNFFCSEKVGGDSSDSSGLPNKYASLWKTNTYYVRVDAPMTDKNTGIARLGGDLILFTESRVFLLPNANYLSKPMQVCGDYGCAFPHTLVKANVPMLGGDVIFFVSNKGPAVVMTGGQVKLLSQFAIKNLQPDELNQGAPAAEIFYTSTGSPTDWYSRRRVKAFYDSRASTYWVFYGDSDDNTSGFAFTSFKQFGCKFDEQAQRVGALEATFAAATGTGKPTITFEPQVIIPKGDGAYVAFCHKVDSNAKQVYRLTEVFRPKLFQDTYINTVSGVTAYAAGICNAVSYDFDFQTGYIYIGKSREYSKQIWSVPVFLKWADSETLHIKLTTDGGRLVSEADFTQERQSGVMSTGMTTIRNKITCLPKAGLWGAFLVVQITKTIPSTGALDFHGFAVKVLSRDIPNEYFATLGALTSSYGGLTFVVEADAVPEVNAYA